MSESNLQASERRLLVCLANAIIKPGIQLRKDDINEIKSLAAKIDIDDVYDIETANFGGNSSEPMDSGGQDLGPSLGEDPA